MRRVWRIEHAERGYGPYAAPAEVWKDQNTEAPGVFSGFQDAMTCAGKYHDMMNRHPIEGWCVSEEKFGRADRIRFAFRSLAKLREWFDYFGDYGYDVLRSAGFHLCLYEVPDAHVLDFDRQSTFNVSHATLIATEEL